jgi:hypothetical protein
MTWTYWPYTTTSYVIGSDPLITLAYFDWIMIAALVIGLLVIGAKFRIPLVFLLNILICLFWGISEVANGWLRLIVPIFLLIINFMMMVKEGSS